MMDFAWTGHRPHLGRVLFVGLFLVFASPFGPLLVSQAGAQAPPNYGFEWATIGSPGNRNANASEAPNFFPPLSTPALHFGGVRDRYRMAKTEVTVGQWLEFVQAYYPFHADPVAGRVESAFTGYWIFARNRNLNQPPEFYMSQGSGQYPSNMSWRFAARYANWLHNGKVNEKWAFENGAYDTSTFTDNPDGTINDQRTRNPDAKFWIPSLDEWIKGMHFDPNKYGPGQEGYWYYPNSSDTLPVVGPPGQPGAESNAGPAAGGTSIFYPVGSYPETTSPWGLLDGSGGLMEMTELQERWGSPWRAMAGSHRWTSSNVIQDRMDEFGAMTASSAGSAGFRIASAVPSPASFALLGAASVFLFSQRRRR